MEDFRLPTVFRCSVHGDQPSICCITIEIAEPEGMWRHYKGSLYEVLHGAKHTETGEALIIYRGEDGKVWARPAENFFDTVEVDGEVRLRFERVKEGPVPEERIPDHVECSHDGCKSVFWRPQDASESLSTIDLAQLRGWTILDREKGLLHCAWGH